jgi:hypothetical protein
MIYGNTAMSSVSGVYVNSDGLFIMNGGIVYGSEVGTGPPSPALTGNRKAIARFGDSFPILNFTRIVGDRAVVSGPIWGRK